MLKFIIRRFAWRFVGRLLGQRSARNARTVQRAVRIARRLNR